MSKQIINTLNSQIQFNIEGNLIKNAFSLKKNDKEFHILWLQAGVTEQKTTDEFMGFVKQIKANTKKEVGLLRDYFKNKMETQS